MADGGFFNNYKPNAKEIKGSYKKFLLKRKKLDIVYTENPPLRKSVYTSDEDKSDDGRYKVSNEEENKENPGKRQPERINDILKDDESSKQSQDKKKPISDTLVDEEEDDDVVKSKLSDTVVDSVDNEVLNEEQLCSKMSYMNVQISSQSLSFENKLSDTVLNTESEQIKSPRLPLQEIPLKMNSRKALFRPELPTVIKNEITEESEQSHEDENEKSEDLIEVLDSEDEKEIDILQPPELRQSDSYINCSSSVGTLNDFFNNIPSVQHPNYAVTHSMIQRFKAQDEIKVSKKLNKSITEESVDDEHIEIGPTDDENDENNIVDLTLDDDSGPKSQGKNQIKKTQLKVNKILTTPNERDKVKKTKSKLSQTPSSLPKSKTAADKRSESESDQVKRTQSKVTPILTQQISSTPSSITKSKSRNVTNINIKFDLKISIKEGSASSEDEKNSSSSTSNNSSNSSSTSSPQIVTRKSIQITSSTSSGRKENQISKKNLKMVEYTEENFHTPNKKNADIVIDEELQSMLEDIYGEGWKTPQLLKSCKSLKFRENLRKSMHTNNFESFMKNLPSDLESTRISTSKSGSERFLKPPKQVFGMNSPLRQIASERKPKCNMLNVKNHLSDNDEEDCKTPIRKLKKPLVKETPDYIEICDTDSSSESDSENDNDYNPNESWNASSDEEYSNEKDRIAKRQSIYKNEIIFIRDDSIEEQEKFDELLKKYEFKKPQQVDSAVKPITKRKLFTNSHYEDEEVPQAEKENVKEKKVEKLLSPWIPKKTPTSIGKRIPVAENLKTPTQPKSIEKLTSSKKKEIASRFSSLSFLKSLDAEANKSLCDPDAIYYRNNYKTKKTELAEKLFKLYNEKVFDLKLINVEIKWNKKLQTTGGRCNNSRHGGVRKSFIELSDKVLTSADRLRCTLIHEMCHAATWILQGENGHGATWKSWTVKANRVFPELPKINVCHSYVIEYKYTYLCIDCRARSQTHSKSKKVEEIRCSLCKGSIQLFENKKNEKGEIEMIPVKKKEPTGFAKFVKEKYKEVKTSNVDHKEAMNILSQKFKLMKVEQQKVN